jgi:NADPH2:quinone reductase
MGHEGLNQGDDITSTVHTVGSNAAEFRPRDGMAGFHALSKSDGGHAEYAPTPSHMASIFS